MRKTKVIFSFLIALSMILSAVPVFAQEPLSTDSSSISHSYKAKNPVKAKQFAVALVNAPNYNWTITNPNLIISRFMSGIKLCYDNRNLFQVDNEFDKSEPLSLSQTEIDKSELLNQIWIDNLILVMNEIMDNIFDDVIVDNESIIIQLNVSSLEQEKIDAIISYISKSSNSFTKEDIIIKNDNHGIIYP